MTKKILMRIDFKEGSYLDLNRGLVGALENMGYKVFFDPIPCEGSFDPPGWDKRVVSPDLSSWVLQVSAPFKPIRRNKKTFIFTMGESTRNSRSDIDLMNSCCGVIVPSGWCADIFSAQGVEVPIHVAPLGITTDFYEAPLGVSGPCRFGYACRQGNHHARFRKNVLGVASAFLEEFSERDVQLSLKVGPGELKEVDFQDDRIEMIQDRWPREELVSWYHSIVCFVSGSCGEGFGLMPLQAMRCGRPVIATTYSGHGEYMSDDVGYPVACDRVRPPLPGIGLWGQPRVSELRKQMRCVYENRAEACTKGRRAVRKAQEFTWERCAQEVIEGLRRFGAFSS